MLDSPLPGLYVCIPACSCLSSIFACLSPKDMNLRDLMCIRKQELCGLVPYAQDILGTSDRA
jgi:hypothetical protein